MIIKYTVIAFVKTKTARRELQKQGQNLRNQKNIFPVPFVGYYSAEGRKKKRWDLTRESCYPEQNYRIGQPVAQQPGCGNTLHPGSY